MSNAQRSPIDRLLKQLTNALTAQSAATGVRSPVTCEISTQADAALSQSDRIVFVPKKLAIKDRPFSMPDDLSQNDQAMTFAVSIYGSSLLRVYDLHAWFAGILDLIEGPLQGCSPSDDAAPAILTGSVDLASLEYPTALLDGLSLAFLAPVPPSGSATPSAARVVSFDGLYDRPSAIAVAINAGAREAKINVLASLDRDADTGVVRLVLTSPQDALVPVPHALTLDPDAAASACAVLGFTADDDNITALSTPASVPYRPGYLIGEGEPGPRGGDLAASGWAVTMPVELRRPAISTHWLTGIIESVPYEVDADGDVVTDTETAGA